MAAENTNNNFSSTEIYSEIATAAEKHKNQQLNFRFKADEMIKILAHLKKTPETEKLIEAVFKDALEKSDKRPMTEQSNLKAKYQKSHGLVLKDIPVHVQRHIIFDAILKMGRTMDFETGRLAFPGGCKLRSFFFPQIKHKEQEHRVCFPIFVNKKDQMFIYQWAQNQNGKIQLDVDKNCGWDGIVSVELTRDSTMEDDDTSSVASGFSTASTRMNFKQKQFQNPVMAGFSPENPFLQNFPMLPFTHGGPISPNPFQMHPNLISHQNMLNQMQQQQQQPPIPVASPVLTATTTMTTNTQVDDVAKSVSTLSTKDSDYYPSEQTPDKTLELEPVC